MISLFWHVSWLAIMDRLTIAIRNVGVIILRLKHLIFQMTVIHLQSFFRRMSVSINIQESKILMQSAMLWLPPGNNRDHFLPLDRIKYSTQRCCYDTLTSARSRARCFSRGVANLCTHFVKHFRVTVSSSQSATTSCS